MKTIVYLIILIGIIIIKTDAVFSQGWERTYSGINIDKGNSVQQTNDNGYIITGETNSFGAGNTDVYLIKTDANGDTLWTKTFGGSNSDEGYSVQQTYDNGYIMVGSTYSFGTGSKDVYLIKTDTNGDTLWTKTFGGTNVDAGSAVQQTIDNGYIIAGYTYSFGAGSQDVYLIKTDTDGDTLWTKTFGGTNIDLGNSVQQTYDNGYIIVGNTFSFGAGNYDVYLIKTDTNGDTLWTKTFGGTNVDVGSAVQQTIDNGFIIAGWTKKSYYAGSWEVYLIKTNADGDTLWTNTFGSAYSDYGRSIQQTNDNGFIIAGYTQNYNFAGDYDAYLIKTNSYGDTIWTRTFGGNNNDFANSVQQTSDHGFIITGGTGSFNEGDTTDIYLIKTDSLGNTITNYINGAVFIDENSNCQMDINEYSLDKCKIKVEPGPIYATPDSNGYYSVLVDTGAYIVSEILPNQLWDVFCPSGSQYTINFNQFYDTASNVNFGNNISILCPLLNITVSSSILRRCFINTYYIKYCNTGTSEASNSYIEISFPPEIIPLSSSLPWSSQTGNIYRFNIGTIDVGDCGSFYITDSVSCEAEIGQTLCVQAHIYPDSLCLPPDTVWDHSSIEVTGSCSNDSLVCFTIYNTGEAGQGDMAGTSNYRVYIDNVMFETGIFQLAGGDSLIKCYPATGQTIRFEADQHPGHPGNSHPNAVVELCGNSQNPSLGFVTTMPEDDEDPFVEIDCNEVVASFDPNEKLVKPKGITDGRFIPNGTQLEYHVNFQNTGTDTAFSVVIRDTISQYLNVETIEFGVTSHPCTYRIFGTGILEWKFHNIILPDSNVNEPESHGFLKYKVRLKQDLANGTLIENRAGIIFDYNAPVIMNTAWNTVYDTTLVMTVPVRIAERKDIFAVFPNPARKELTIQIKTDYTGKIEIDLINGTGMVCAHIFKGNVQKGTEKVINFKPKQGITGLYLVRMKYGDRVEVRKVIFD